MWEALTQYNLPLDLARFHQRRTHAVFNGARSARGHPDGALGFLGVEIEAMAIALSNGHGSHPLYALSPELRFYVGLANPSADAAVLPAAIGPRSGSR